MQTNEPRLKVQCGQQVFGPMSLTDLAELLAAERFNGSDLVSEEDGPWVTIEEYVARQSEPPPQPASPDDDFRPVFDSAPPMTERQPPPPPPPADDEPLFKPPQPVGPDSDYMLQTDPNEESEYVPLSESLDPSPAGSGESSSTDAAGFYQVGRPEPTAEPSEPVPLPPPPSMPPPPAAGFPEYNEPSPPVPDESALDDILDALSQDEAEAPEAKRPRRKRTSPKGTGRPNPKRPKRKRKRR